MPQFHDSCAGPISGFYLPILRCPKMGQEVRCSMDRGAPNLTRLLVWNCEPAQRAPWDTVISGPKAGYRL